MYIYGVMCVCVPDLHIYIYEEFLDKCFFEECGYIYMY